MSFGSAAGAMRDIMWKIGNVDEKKFTVIIVVFVIAVLTGGYACALHNQHEATDPSVYTPAVPEKHHGIPYVEFVAVGDAGTGGLGQILVAEAMAEHASRNHVEFVLMLGDNFYSYGVESVHDTQWESKFRDMYYHASLQVPFYAVLGNHDHYGNPDAQVDYTHMPGNSRWKMPSRYYTFKHSIDKSATVQFFALDTTSIIYDRDSALKQLKWLEKALKNSHAEWKIVFGHHPLYSGGVYGDNERMKKKLERLFIKYKIDLYLAGHDHDQQLLGPIEGVHYIVNGAGSKVRSTRGRQHTIYANSNVGFVRFRVSRDNLEVSFINSGGTGKYTYNISCC